MIFQEKPVDRALVFLFVVYIFFPGPKEAGRVFFVDSLSYSLSTFVALQLAVSES